MSGPARRRIAMLGWAWPPLQERQGTGYNLVQSELAASLAARGHEVAYLRSGWTYTIRPGVRIREHGSWRGVRCFDLVNSPNLATADRNFLAVESQVSAPEHSAAVAAWARSLGAHVAHVQSFEGFGFDLVAELNRAGLPVVVTPHNYYALCPQVDLMHAERDTCGDYDGGSRCRACIPAPDPSAEMRSRRWPQPDAPRPAVTPLSHADSPTPEMPITPPGVERRLLDNPHHLRVLGEHGRRRVAGVGALNLSRLVLCPGRGLLEIHAAMGVGRDRLRHVPIGLPHIDSILSAPCPQHAWTVSDSRPLRVAYLGSAKPNKGLGVLCRALASLSPAVQGRLDVTIHASGDIEPFRRLVNGMPNVGFRGAYTPADAAGLVTACDVGVFPNMGLENCPLVLLEFLSAGRCVLASDLGASHDWIRPGENGLLFPAGDHGALARLLTALVQGQPGLPAPAVVRAACGVPAHAEYVRANEAAYADAVVS